MSTWVNGRAATRIDARDRGFNYGDGVFETMRVRGRGVRFLDYHLARLDEGCRRLGIARPLPRVLRRELDAAAARRVNGVLKLVVTRGVGERGYRPTGQERCTRVLSLHPLVRSPTDGPRAARLCDLRLGVNRQLAGLKTLNRLECVLARAEWRDPGIWEGLLRDTDGYLVCGTMSNLFLRSGSALMTPKLDRCGVAGVMRRWVLETAGALELRVRETRLTWRDVVKADEVFMTNAVAGVVPLGLIQHGRTRLGFAETATSASAALRRLLESQ
jgi:4-amino-4-deoxychorismate lyase